VGLLLLVVTFSFGADGLLDSAQAEPVYWSGNGHWYEAVGVPTGISWTDARDASTARGGFLADITSPEENAFVYSLLDMDTHPELWQYERPSDENIAVGPWLGGYQPDGSSEPGGNFRWVSTGAQFMDDDGNPTGYTNWRTGQPNDNYLGRAVEEEALHFYNSFGVVETWNDYPVNPTDSQINGYVVEFVPEPSAALLALLGMLLINVFGRLSVLN
jgi:hypothetical protein